MALKIKNLCRLFCNRYAEVQYDFFLLQHIWGRKKTGQLPIYCTTYVPSVKCENCPPTPRGPWHPPRMGTRQNISHLAILDMQLAQAVKMGNADRKMVFLSPLERPWWGSHTVRGRIPTIALHLQFWQTWSFGNLRFYCNVDTQVWGREKGRGGKEDRPYQLINISTVCVELLGNWRLLS